MAFFIGWAGLRDPAARKWLSGRVLVLLVVLALLGFVLAVSQRTIGPGTFNFGHIQEFQGLFLASPTPLLLTDQPVSGERLFFLVRELKFGIDPQEAEPYHLRRVRLSGTLISDPSASMIEVQSGSIQILEASPQPDPGLSGPRVEEVILRGEIVDSKCQLGAMNPGRLKPHRACAIHCLRGGIPPLLRVEGQQEQPAYVLLMGEEGQPINQQLLPFVALPVEVSGNLRRFGNYTVLYLNPEHLRVSRGGG